MARHQSAPGARTSPAEVITNNWLLRGEYLYYSLGSSPSVVIGSPNHLGIRERNRHGRVTSFSQPATCGA
jgi:hypothetical protein